MPSQPTSKKSSWPVLTIRLSLLIPTFAAILVYQLDSFDPAPIPTGELTRPLPDPAKIKKNDQILKGSEFLGEGKLLGPEDIAFDPESMMIYTSCSDGWVKRVTVNESVVDSVVENWVNTGGRPLGLAVGPTNEIIVADAYKGLLKISKSGGVEVLTEEAEGVKFKLTDGVDIAKDGTIYFTDASSKYDLDNHMYDILEGRPNGRLLSYKASTGTTHVLLRHLYFPNGLALSPLQDFLVFCETPLRRCRKYNIEGKKKGTVEDFVDLSGLPDNIHYDGHGHFWVASSTEATPLMEVAFRYPIMRKIAAIVLKYIGRIKIEKNGGVVAVDLQGKLISHYYDYRLSFISSGLKIHNHLYIGSIVYPYIIRLDIDSHAAQIKAK